MGDERTFVKWVEKIEELTGVDYLGLVDMRFDLYSLYVDGASPEDVSRRVHAPKRTTYVSFFNVEV